MRHFLFSRPFKGIGIVFVLTILQFIPGFLQAQFTQGNLVVLVAQGGTSSSTALALVEYTPTGSQLDSVIIPSTTAGARITESGSAGSEGYFSPSAELDRLIVVGYDAAPGVSSITGTSSSSTHRVIGQVDHAGSFTFGYGQNVYSGNNIRGGTAYGSSYFATGAGGSAYVDLMNSNAFLNSTAANNRVIRIINGQVYFTIGSGSSTFGLYQLGSGISTSTGQSTTLLATDATTNGPYGFDISPDGNTLYMADGSTGILKYTRTGGTGTFTAASYTVYNHACSGIAVDFTTSSPTIYATTSDFLYLIKLQDNGTANTTAEASLAIATSNASYPFKGVCFAPAAYATVSGTASICTGTSTSINFKGNPFATVSYNINGGSTLTTTLNSNGASSVSTGTLTSNATYNLVSVTNPTGTVSVTGSATVTVISSPAAILGTTGICVGASSTLTDGTTGGTWSSSNTSVATIGTTGMITGAGAGSAVITYAIACGSAYTTVTVNPLPGNISGTASFCQGTSTTLSEGTSGGTWSSSNAAVGTVSNTGVVYGVAQGSATISYTLGTGCYSAYSVTVNPSTPPTGIISGAPYVEPGGTTTLSETISGGTWSSGASSIASIGTTGIVTGASIGTAIISYAVISSCGTGYATQPVTVFNNTFSPGNLSVLMVGNGSVLAGGTTAPIAVVEYATTGAPTGTGVMLPSSGTPQITISGTATSEGQMTMSAERDRIVIAGYDAAAGISGITSSASATYNREIFTLNSAGTYSKVAASSTAYNDNNIRSGTASGTNYFGAGPTSGLELMNSSTQLTSAPTNARIIQIFNGQSYFSSSTTSFFGISTLGSGIPTTTGQTSTLITPTIYSSFGFSISPDGTTMYVADDGTGTSATTTGITKYTYSSGSFSYDYVVNSTPVRGLTVDYSGTQPKIYVTTSTGDSIIAVTDAGSGSGFTTVAIAPTNNFFRGVTFSPSCYASVAPIASGTICTGTGTSVVISGNPTSVVSYNINGGSTFTTTIGVTGLDTLSTGMLTSNTTYNLLNINTPSCSTVSLSGSTTINVIPTVISGTTGVCAGASTSLTDGTVGGTWNSSNNSVASVGSTGIVAGVSAGSATITYTVSGCTSTTSVVVNPVPASISGTTLLCTGQSATLTDATSGGSWSSNNANATIGSGTGILTGVTAGSAVISYTLTTGCFNTSTITISPLPAAIMGMAGVCYGQSTTLSDATTGGTWASGNNAVAMIGSGTGIVSAVSAGTTSITYTSGPGCIATAIVTVNPLPSITSTGNNSPICAGTTLNITSAATGAGTLMYSWTGPNTFSASIQNPFVSSATTAANGTYSLTVTDANNCKIAGTTTATVSPDPSITSANNSGPICAGITLNLSVTGASNVTGYQWTGPVSITSATSASASVPSATTAANGVYTVTVNNGTGTGCTASYTTSATVSPDPTISSANNSGPICAGTTLNLSVTGASNVTGYQWTGPVSITSATSASASVPSATSAANGVYTVTVNNGTGTGCMASYTTSATVSPDPSISSANNSGPICAGTTLNLSVTGASNVTGYQWTGPVSITSATSASASVPSATTAANGVYTVTVNDGTGTGCTASYTTSATVSPDPTISSANNSGPICAGTTLNLTVTGASNVTGYQWAGPVSITSATSASASVPSATTAASGVYTVTVNDGTGTGCTASYTTSATVSPDPSISSANNSGPICAGTTLNLSVTGASNVTGYQWTGPVSITSATSASASVPSATTAANGVYTVTVNNGTGTGCTASYTTSATVSPDPTISSANNSGPICSGATLNLSVTGASNVTGYQWTGPVSITSATSASASVPSATTAANGVYTVTVNNGTGTGCTASYTTSATVSPDPSITSANNSGPICAGTTLNLSVTGASNVTGYQWTGPVSITSATSASASVPSATTAANGVYTVTVNNGTGTGCTASYTTSATVSPDPSISSANNSGPKCSGATLNLSVTGASNVTGYQWTGPVSITSATSASASVPSATTAASGVYTVTVNNGTGTGCAASYTTSATVNALPVITSISNSGPVCYGSTLNLNSAATGAGTVNYSWIGPNSFSSSVENPSIIAVTTAATGTYTLTVTDANTCSVKNTTYALVNSLPVITSIGNNGPLCAGNALDLTSTVTGAGTVLYSWSGPAAFSSTNENPVITAATTGATGTYTLSATDSNGCTSFGNTSATINPLPVISSIGSNSPVCSGNTLSLTNTTTGGTGSYSFSWAGPGIFTSSIQDPSILLATTSATGTYTLTVRDSVNCSATGTTSATVNPSPALTPASSVTICPGSSVTITASGEANYSWSPGTGLSASTGTSVVATPTTSTTYTATGAITGCSSSVAVNISFIPGTGQICTGSTYTYYVGGGGTWSTSNTSIATIGSITGLVSGIAAGTVTISYSDSACTITKVLSVNQSPYFITGPANQCTGASTTLSDYTTGGVWTSSNTSNATVGSNSGIVTGVNSGYATISYSVSTGCFSILAVTVNPSPAAISGPSAQCTGASTQLYDVTPGGMWSSSNTSSVTVGTTGVVTGVTPSMASVLYTLASGCNSSLAVTVNASPAAISGVSTVCTGIMNNFSDITTGGLWSSTNSSVALIGSASGIVNGVSAGTSIISYAVGTGCASMKTVTVSASPASVSGNNNQCSGVNALFTDATPGGNWSSSNTSSATINSSTGIMTGVSPGNSTITYSVPSGCYSTILVTVNATPASVSGSPGLCTGTTTSYSDATPGGAWTSTDPTVASMGSMSGLLTGVTAGTTIISYTLTSGCSNTQLVTVVASPLPITGPTVQCTGYSTNFTDGTTGGTWTSSNTSAETVGYTTGVVSAVGTGMADIVYSESGCNSTLTVTVSPTPNSITGAANVCSGTSTSFTDATTGGLWSSTNTAIATVGSVSGSLSGVVAGTTIISYTLPSGCASFTPFTVNVSPAPISGLPNQCTGVSNLFTDVTPVGSWISSNTSAATVGSSSGIVTGLTTGATTISYTVAGCNSILSVTVNTSPNSISGTSPICTGASSTFSDATSGGTWTSNNSSVAGVGASTGVVTGVAAGTVIISYTVASGCSSIFNTTINPSPAAITGPLTQCTGTNTQLGDITSGGLWSSSNTSAATVGSVSGIVTGVAPGAATISYSFAGCYSTQSVTVNSTPYAISAGVTKLCSGTSATYTDASTGGTWSSSNTSVGTVTTSGMVTGVASGTFVISYSLGSGCASAAGVTVNTTPAPITGSGTQCTGATGQLSDVTSGGIWSSSNTSAATVGSTTGIVTGVAATLATISYTISGCYSLKTVTVNTSPYAVVGTTPLCTGVSSTYSDATTGGMWSSNNPTVASVGSTTAMVTGVSAGTTIITYTAATGCSSTKSLTVNASPASISGSGNLCTLATALFTDATSGGTWSSSNTSGATVGGTTGIVTGVASSILTISYSYSGCYSLKSVTVYVSPNAVSGTVSICNGASATLSDATTGGAWSSSNTSVATVGTGSGTVTGVSAGTASISYTVSNGCLSSKVMTINPIPSAGVISGLSSVAIGHSVTLTETVSGGTWTSSSTGIATVGASTGVVTGVSTGNAVITYTVTSLGCSAYTNQTESVSITGRGSATEWVICTGSSIVINAGNQAGQWTSSNETIAIVDPQTGTVTGIAKGIATITFTSDHGEQTLFKVVVNQLPDAVLIQANPGTVISSGESVTFTGTIANGGTNPAYQWTINGTPVTGATLPVFTTSNLQNHDVVSCIAGSSSGCGDYTISNSAVVTVINNANYGTGNSDVKVIPNPNKGEFIVTGSLGMTVDVNVTLELTDLLGNTVYSQAFVATNGWINQPVTLPGSLSNGMYLLTIHTQNGNTVLHVEIAQ